MPAATTCQGPGYWIATGMAQRIGLRMAKWIGFGPAKRIGMAEFGGLGHPRLTRATVARLLHQSHMLILKGDSHRYLPLGRRDRRGRHRRRCKA